MQQGGRGSAQHISDHVIAKLQDKKHISSVPDTDLRSYLKKCWEEGIPLNITYKLDESEQRIFTNEVRHQIQHITRNGIDANSEKQLLTIMTDCNENLSPKEYDRVQLPQKWIEETFARKWENQVPINIQASQQTLKFVATDLINRRFSDRRCLQVAEISFLNALLQDCYRYLNDPSFTEVMLYLTFKISSKDYDLFSIYFDKAAQLDFTIRDKFAQSQKQPKPSAIEKKLAVVLSILISIFFLFLALFVGVYQGLFDQKTILFGVCTWIAFWLQGISIALLQQRLQGQA